METGVANWKAPFTSSIAKVIHDATAGEIRGHEENKQFLDTFLKAFPDLQVTVDDLVAEEDKVVARFTVRGTHRGTLMGIAPTGKNIEISAISIMRVDGGKFVEEWEVYDALGMMQQLGAIPPAGEN